MKEKAPLAVLPRAPKSSLSTAATPDGVRASLVAETSSPLLVESSLLPPAAAALTAFPAYFEETVAKSAANPLLSFKLDAVRVADVMARARVSAG